MLIPDEWVKCYLEKSGDKYVMVDNVMVEEHGFMTFSIYPDCVVVYNAYGNGKLWLEKAKEVARRHGKTKILFATKRNPKVFERRFGAKLSGYVMEIDVEDG